jgi:hypothetical protein
MAAIDGQITPNAHITLLRDGAWERELTASADGWYGAVDLPPGVYSVVVRHPEDGRTTRIDGLPVRAGVVTSGP